LAGVEGLGPEQPPGRQGQVGVLGDKGGILPSKLKADGGEGLCGFLRNDGTDLGSACIEDLVPLLLEQGGSLGNGAVDHSEGVRIQGFQDFNAHHGTGRGHLGRLEDCGTAGSDGTDERSQEKVDGVVVGADDEHGTHRLLSDSHIHHGIAEGHIWRAKFLILGKGLEVGYHEHAVILEPLHLGEGGLEPALPQILLQGILDLGAQVG